MRSSKIKHNKATSNYRYSNLREKFSFYKEVKIIIKLITVVKKHCCVMLRAIKQKNADKN